MYGSFQHSSLSSLSYFALFIWATVPKLRTVGCRSHMIKVFQIRNYGRETCVLRHRVIYNRGNSKPCLFTVWCVFYPMIVGLNPSHTQINLPIVHVRETVKKNIVRKPVSIIVVMVFKAVTCGMLAIAKCWHVLFGYPPYFTDTARHLQRPATWISRGC